MLDKEHCRDNMIHKICMAILKKRLEQMKPYKFKLMKMPDVELFEEFRKYVKK